MIPSQRAIPDETSGSWWEKKYGVDTVEGDISAGDRHDPREQMDAARIEQDPFALVDDEVLVRLHDPRSRFRVGAEPDELMVLVLIEYFSIFVVSGNHRRPP